MKLVLAISLRMCYNHDDDYSTGFVLCQVFFLFFEQDFLLLFRIRRKGEGVWEKYGSRICRICVN